MTHTLAAYRFYLFGNFEIHYSLHDQRPIQLAYDKGRALLAYLIVHAGQEKARSQLAQMLWPELPREAGLTNLRLVLHDIRQKLSLSDEQQELIISNRTHLMFNPDYQAQVDYCRFQNFKQTQTDLTAANAASEWQSVLQDYRGHLLEQSEFPHCDEFEEWLQIKRENCLRKALSMLEQLCNYQQQQGAYTQALNLANRYCELDPWNEAAHRLVMRLHVANQQKATALAHFDHCKRVLHQELGVTPSKATQQLADLIVADLYQEQARASEIHLTERRQITVLCCEITAIEQDDPEADWQALHSARLHCQKLLQAANAHLADQQGDSFLAYFGFPLAQEFAARDAVETGLRLLAHDYPGCQLRLGIHTGVMLVTAGQTSPEQIGATCELALRLRLIAEPGEMIISRHTHLLTQGYFTYSDLGEQVLRGFRQSVHPYRILARNQVRDRLQANPQLSPYAGRQAELARLRELWQACQQGQFRVLAIQAEAGVGKSRLVQEFVASIPDQEMNYLVLRGLPEQQHSSYAPFIQLLEQQFNWHELSSADQKLQQLSDYAQLITPDQVQESVVTLASLLQLSLPADFPQFASSPQKLRERVIDLALHRLRMLSADGALLLYLEDLHWFDASSLEIIQHLLQQHNLAVLIIISSRSELPAEWQTLNQAELATMLELMHLNPLDLAETMSLIRALYPAASPELQQKIWQQSDGVPLFTEEICKFADAHQDIPSTLHDLLASRLDRLGETRFIAQTAATIGREFEIHLLGRCLDRSETELTQDLDLLSQAGIIHLLKPNWYRFKHALTRDAAYHTLSKQGRRQCHARIAQAILDLTPELGMHHPELLAYHYQQAQDYLPAIHYWYEAGINSAKLFANHEALQNFEQGLQLAQTLSDTDQGNTWSLRLLLQIFTCQRTLYGYGSSLANDSLEQAIAISDQQSDHPYLFQAIWNIWSSSSTRTGYQDSLRWARRLAELADRHHDPVQIEQANYTLCNTLMWLGQFDQARHYAELVMRDYQPENETAHRQQFGENPYINAGSHLSWILWFNGETEQAQAMSAAMLAAADQLAHPYSQCFALCFASVLQRWMGQPAEALQLAARGIQLSTLHGFQLWQAACVMVHGWAGACLGNATGMAELNGSIAAMRAVMGGAAIGFLTPQADALIRQHDYQAALTVIDEALQVAAHLSDGHATAELLRMQALCQWQAAAAPELARQTLQRALTLAQQQNNRAIAWRIEQNLQELDQLNPQACHETGSGTTNMVN